MTEFEQLKPVWSHISSVLNEAITSILPLSGNQFSEKFQAQTERGKYFVKISSDFESLQSEHHGLKEIDHTNTIRVPKPIHVGKAANHGILVTEYLEMDNSKRSYSRLASDLIKLHRIKGFQFGWYEDNFIGGNRQINTPLDSWPDFFDVCRLRYQRDLAFANGYRGNIYALCGNVLEAIPFILAEHAPEPSLVHGDLWSGNCGFCDGVPVIFDPAIYHGDRETDLAMMRLFGGFPERFYREYTAAWELPEGWELRQKVYSLYHILNHLNLFGPTYFDSAELLMRKILESLT